MTPTRRNAGRRIKRNRKNVQRSKRTKHPVRRSSRSIRKAGLDKCIRNGFKQILKTRKINMSEKCLKICNSALMDIVNKLAESAASRSKEMIKAIDIEVATQELFSSPIAASATAEGTKTLMLYHMGMIDSQQLQSLKGIQEELDSYEPPKQDTLGGIREAMNSAIRKLSRGSAVEEGELDAMKSTEGLSDTETVVLPQDSEAAISVSTVDKCLEKEEGGGLLNAVMGMARRLSQMGRPNLSMEEDLPIATQEELVVDTEEKLPRQDDHLKMVPSPNSSAKVEDENVRSSSIGDILWNIGRRLSFGEATDSGPEAAKNEESAAEKQPSDEEDVVVSEETKIDEAQL